MFEKNGYYNWHNNSYKSNIFENPNLYDNSKYIFDQSKSVNIDNNIIYNKYEFNNKSSLTDKTNYEKNISKGPRLCGIENFGHNCYFNSGLQILVSCESFVEELKKINNNKPLTYYIKKAIDILINGKIYDSTFFLDFFNYFSKKNSDFFAFEGCSQNFIRTLLKNLNDELISNNENLITKFIQYKPKNRKENNKYNNFLEANNIFPESRLLSLFSGINKSHSTGQCDYCGRDIEEFSFCYFIDLNIYLDKINNRCKFSEVLDKNMNNNILTMNCPFCSKEINILDESYMIKLPEILIFTLERYQKDNNDVEIEPDNYIDMKKYVDINYSFSTKYELNYLLVPKIIC